MQIAHANAARLGPSAGLQQVHARGTGAGNANGNDDSLDDKEEKELGQMVDWRRIHNGCIRAEATQVCGPTAAFRLVL